MYGWADHKSLLQHGLDVPLQVELISTVQQLHYIVLMQTLHYIVLMILLT